MNENNIIYIHIEKDYKDLINQDRLQFLVNTILSYFDKNNIECTISFVGEKQIHELNIDFRSIDSKTDVLSFSANDMNPETRKINIGDVIICYPVAAKQSLSAHHQIVDEIDLLTIHGILHLLGYDHESKEEEKKMLALQSRFFKLIKEHVKKTEFKMILVINSILNSFRFALNGVRFALKTQRNLHIHLTIASLVTLFSIFLHCSSLEITILLLIIVVVLSLELINTAIEATIDLVSPHSQPLARIAKDLGAAAVLISALCSVLIGVIILGPKLISLLF